MEDPGPTKHTKVLFPFSRHFACLVGKFRVRCGEMAEGVVFEPTVGFPTLDFESSALNRTQPPFRIAPIVDLILRHTISAQPTSQRQRALMLAFSGGNCARGGQHRRRHEGSTGRCSGGPVAIFKGGSAPKKCYNFRLAMSASRAAYCVPAGEPRYYLLLTGIHRLLAPLFTSIRMLLGTSTLFLP